MTATSAQVSAASAAATVLDDALALLDVHAVPHALVRSPGRDGRGVLEADLLVAPRDLGPAEAALGEAGFRRRPGWGRRPHRFHVRPVDGPDGLDWLKLDLVTDLAFGPLHEWTTSLAATCLARRRPGPPARLDPADEVAALVAHVLVDRGRVRPHDAARLTDLRPALAGAPGPAGLALLGPEGWERAAAAVAAEDWDALLALTPTVRHRLRAGDRRGPARAVRHRVARRAKPLLDAVAAPGPVVALVGPDGTGKSTLTGAVVASCGLPARALYGGTYTSGTRGLPVPGGTTAVVVGRLLRTRGALAWHRRRGRLVVLDRHPAEARPGPEDSLGPKARLRRRAIAALLPRPDALVVLDAPAAVLHARRPEHSLDHLERDRRRHLAMDVGCPTTVVDAAAAPEVVRDRTVRLVWDVAVPRQIRPWGPADG